MRACFYILKPSHELSVSSLPTPKLLGRASVIMRRVLYRMERLLFLLVAIVVSISLVSVCRLPQPVRHPAFNYPKLVRSMPKATKVCDGYDGVLHIRSGDAGAAAGTVFFIYVVNQLIYADKYNLLPWIHLNNISKHVYDPIVHNNKNGTQETTFDMLHGMTVPFVSDGYQKFGFGAYAGAPAKILPNYKLTKQRYQVTGTGVWNHYFKPVSNFDPTAVSSGDCQLKPLLRMHYFHLNPSMLFYCPWSVKSWPYHNLQRKLVPLRNSSLKEWYEPMRRRGHQIVHKYIRFQPHIVQKANELLQLDDAKDCLALHVRHSDKGGINRRQIPLDKFFSYANAYAQAGGTTIYLATDSNQVLETVLKWHFHNNMTILHQSGDVIRSSNRKAVFTLAENSHHRTNTEVLVDILAMSRCRFLVHGFSAVSEAVMYLNLDLHTNSVDLEDHPNNIPTNPKEFETLVRKNLGAKEQRR